VVMTESSDEHGVLAVTLGADGTGGDMLIVPAGGSRLPVSRETLEKRQNYVHMDGRNVFRFSVKILPEMIRNVLTSAGLDLEDVALIVPHQANSRIVATAAKALDVPVEKFFLNMHAYGNTSAASIPIALVEAVDAGLIQPGDVVLLAGFGGGLTWGAAAVRWCSRPTPSSASHDVSRRQPAL